MLINWTEFFWAIIWDLGAISWCLIIRKALKYFLTKVTRNE